MIIRNGSKWIRIISQRTKVSITTAVGGYSKGAHDSYSYYMIEKDKEQAGIDSLGEDAFYLNKTKSDYDSYGVADGVGGWRNQGVDPSLFSSTLMRECLLASSQMNETSCPKGILEEAMININETHKNTNYSLLGSSTAITSIIDKEAQSARICNLGDSGYLHIRAGRVISKSKDQTHYFNCPYQLAASTPGSRSITDTPKKGDIYKIKKILPQDILLLATDGLFDNVPQEYIEGLLNDVTEENLQMKLIELIRLGLTISLDDKFLSPFAIAARAEGYKKEIGGKLDDFTVLINLFH